MNFTISDILRAPHLKSIGLEKLSAKTRIKNVSTDSRQIRKGDLFIALRGENFDGHLFLSQVAKAGAIAAVVDEKWYKKNAKTVPKRFPLLVVKDTLHTYGDLANIYRNKFTIPIVLVAGSNGKTTTKDVISHVLAAKYSVLKTEANYNNHVGLPRMLFSLTSKHDIAIIEIGTNHPGEIARLTEIAEPTHGIITNIGREHLEFFKDLKGVAKEELALFDYLSAHDGTAIINLDDRYIRTEAKRFHGFSETYSTTSKADVRAASKGFTADGKLRVEVLIGKQKIALRTSIIAEYAPSLIAAVNAIAIRFGVSPSSIKKSLEEYKPHSKRMEMIRLANGALVINDTYNANPESFDAALETLYKIPATGKKYLAAGDMFELGNTSAREHTKLGKVMASYKFDGYYFAGEAMKNALRELKKTFKKASAIHTAKNEIVASLRSQLKKDDVLLLKGSRGMRMEEILSQLKT
ncbi:MAG TPA: UDP-N-acetylmuramoyl-tripeptide--D-alanyl-D-alanine ligase [Candidatus Kapabacteria bacterium]|nr:UDP-N-acetylmuramoyl-tripeptide--D-alanyl-D-alanine ligase [Candidatus Kapabacteria bacterium]